MQKLTYFWRSMIHKHSWLSPRMGVKRWLMLFGLGTIFIGMGIAYLLMAARQAGWLPDSIYDFLTLQTIPIWGRILLFLALGGGIILATLFRLSRSGQNLTAPVGRPSERAFENKRYDFGLQSRGPHIVAIGGGTGMPSLLRGLRNHTRNITAIVTVADDGGSSGRLRQDFGLLPPGDFRNNLAALARDEALMTQVLQYRFGGPAVGNGQNELRGHAFGNLLLAALTGITGSFNEALLAAESVLALRGRVLPSTLAEVTLLADVEVADDASGTAVTHQVAGESAIPKAGGRIKRVYLDPASVRAYPPTLKAIFKADLIVMGPGSLYTSILPNLLVPDLAEALRHARAPKIYVCNLATQPGETDNYGVAEHVATILQHVPTGCLDFVLANNNLSVPPQKGGGKTIYVQPTVPEQVEMITADLVDEERPWRHDSDKLAVAVMNLLPDYRKT